MPLNTVIERDGKPLQVGWSGFHVAAMVCASSWDSGRGPFKDNTETPVMTQTSSDGVELTGHFIGPADAWALMDYGVLAMTPLNEGRYTLTRDFTFIDCSDCEVLTLKEGDVLKAWRS